DFDFDPQTGTVSCRDENIGEYSVVYVDAEGVRLEKLSTAPGMYTVKVSTDENDSYKACSELTGPWFYYVDSGSVSVGTGSGKLVYGSAGTARYSLKWSGVSLNVTDPASAPAVKWISAEPEGLNVSFSNGYSTLMVSSARNAAASAGKYRFNVTYGSLVTDEMVLVIEPRQVRMPDVTETMAYNGKVQRPAAAGEGYMISGTESAEAVGTYKAVIELADVNNYVWTDGSTKPLTVNWEITRRPVTVSNIKVFDKVCDGTCTCEINCTEAKFKGILKCDELICTGVGAFESPRVGSGKNVELTLTLEGPDKDNYYIDPASQTFACGTIVRGSGEGKAEYITEPEHNYRNGDIAGRSAAIEQILSSDDIKLIKNGANVKVWLSISDISSFVTDTDIRRVESASNGANVGAYLDINIYTKYGESTEAVKLSETKEEVTIEFKVPQNLKNKNSSIYRTYQLVRIHDGIAEVIDAEYNSSDDMLCFRTDKFSTYALIYKDVRVRDARRDFFVFDTQSRSNKLLFSLIGIVLAGSLAANFYLVKKPEKDTTYTAKH
ncbi:MAG: hypothetical protein J6Z29_02720, partial [Ruminococcus sp.]|nr:hypothetical protein [Ruminococcus sp.]